MTETPQNMSSQSSDFAHPGSNSFIAKKILNASLLTSIVCLTASSKDAFSLYFLSSAGFSDGFAAYGFGVTFMLAFGTGIGFGLSAGFGTLASQAYGAMNYKEFGKLCRKIQFVLGIVFLVMSVFFVNSGIFLKLVGFSDDFIAIAQRAIRYLILSFFGNTIFSYGRFLTGVLNLFKVSAFASISSFLLHIPLSYYTIYVWKYGMEGACITRGIIDLASALVIILYLWVKNPCPEGVVPFNRESLEGTWSFFKKIAVHGWPVYSAWITMEMSTFIVGFLNDIDSISVNTCVTNFFFLVEGFLYGINVSVGIFTGQLAGLGKASEAKKYAKIGSILDIVGLVIMTTLTYVFAEFIVSFYIGSVDLIEDAANTLRLVCFGFLPCFGGNFVTFFMRSLGQEKYCLFSYFLSLYGLGVPMAILLGFFADFGVEGVWAGYLIGMYLFGVLIGWKAWKIDWEEEVMEIAKKYSRREDSEAKELLEVK